MATMQGKGSVRFSELFWDSIWNLGYTHCKRYYLSKGMSPQEFEFWLLYTRA